MGVHLYEGHSVDELFESPVTGLFSTLPV
jgi:hypothetical protein